MIEIPFINLDENNYQNIPIFWSWEYDYDDLHYNPNYIVFKLFSYTSKPGSSVLIDLEISFDSILIVTDKDFLKILEENSLELTLKYDNNNKNILYSIIYEKLIFSSTTDLHLKLFLVFKDKSKELEYKLKWL